MDEINKESSSGQVLIFQSRGFSKEAQAKTADYIRAYMKEHPGSIIKVALVDQTKTGIKLTLFIDGK